MTTILITVHLLIALGLVALVLLQRSEGGALGMGGGGNGAFKSRGKGSGLTRMTAYLAAGFFASSIALTLLANIETKEGSLVDKASEAVGGKPTPPAPSFGGAPQPALKTPDVSTPKPEAKAPEAKVPEADAITPPGTAEAGKAEMKAKAVPTAPAAPPAPPVK